MPKQEVRRKSLPRLTGLRETVRRITQQYLLQRNGERMVRELPSILKAQKRNFMFPSRRRNQLTSIKRT
jgi:hypothetical protein